MPSPNPMWLTRLPADVRRRLDLAEATAREGRTEAHANQALDLVAILAPRMPFDEAVERYIEIMNLDGEEAEMVHIRALKLLSEREVASELARERRRGGGFRWQYVTPVGAFRYIRRQRRRSAEEELWMELAAARAEEALARTHVEHARAFVDLLEAEADPSRAVSLYLDRMNEPESRARSIYQRTLAELAETLLPRLLDYAEDEDEPRPE
jgi:Rad3-related DNA helicase